VWYKIELDSGNRVNGQKHQFGVMAYRMAKDTKIIASDERAGRQKDKGRRRKAEGGRRKAEGGRGEGGNVAEHPGRWGSGALLPPAVHSLVESHCAMFMSAGMFGSKLLRSLDLKLGRKSI
jgi:hypothetical protein